jgi:predicted permease
LARLLAWLRRTSADPLGAAAIDREIENHILERAEKLIAEGMPARRAYREAERRFGSVHRVRRTLERIDQSMDARIRRNEFFGSVFRDLGQGVRLLRSSPGFALAVILTIGLGVGANTAVFSITDAVLLRPLPFRETDELVRVDRYDPVRESVRRSMLPGEAMTWEREAPIDGLVLHGRVDGLVRTDGDEPISVAVEAVSPGWLAALGRMPRLGRSFVADDAVPGAPPVLIVSDAFWRDRLAGDRAAIGETIDINRRPVTVIGVMAADFKFPQLGRIDAWAPLAADATGLTRPLGALSIVARLPEGIEIAAAQERFAAVSSGLEADDPQERGWQVRLAPLDDFRANRDVQRALWILTGAVGVMLLIATINATNLLLLRAASRRPETSVRMALGASRARLVRQHATESLVLVGAGVLLAVLLARLILGSLVDLLPSEVTAFLTSNIAINGRVLAFALAVASITGVMLSLLPALRATATPSSTGGRASTSPRGTRLRNFLVVAEVAMTVTLLVGAGLFINSFLRLTAVDTGYEPERMIQLSVSLPAETYPDRGARVAFFRRLKEALGALPGVTAIALADGVPPGGAITFGVTPRPEGQEPKDLPELFIPRVWVEPEFFEVIGTPIVAGRGFTGEDTPESGNVVVDRDMSHFLWGDESPIGRRFKIEDDDPWLTVIGMVDEAKIMGKDDRQGSIDLFELLPPESMRSYMSVVMRAGVEPAALLPQIRRTVHDLDPVLPISRLATGDERLAEELDKPRFYLLMMSNFAAIALALAVIGTYGVLAFAVRQRRRELGVRLALGASGGRLVGMVLRQGMVLAGIGVVLGLAGALAVGRVAASLLFELEPTDPLTFVAVAAVMLACAALACWLPARRATRVDPVEVLRAE